jgi:hypothetical protein
MKSLLTLVAICALACALTGCNNNKTTDKASPGAMRECPACAGGKCDCVCCKAGGTKMNTASGCCCVGDVACCKDKANMGAVSDKKSGCCSEVSKTNGASMGAVSEKKSCASMCPVTGKAQK